MRNGNTTWRMFTRAHEAWGAVLDSFRTAKHSIKFKDYILRDTDDPAHIGRHYVDLLKQKALEGVSVRIVLDGTGSWTTYVYGVGKELRDAGVHIHFHTITLQKRFPLHFFARDHRKFAIVDGRTLYIGGVIVEERARRWRDTHIEFRGPIVRDAERLFASTWSGLDQEIGPETARAPDRSPAFSLVSSGPGAGHAEIFHMLIERIDAAHDRVCITSPFFSPPRALVDALVRAKRRGVYTALLLPAVELDGVALIASESFYPELIAEDIGILFYPEYIHAKIAIIDQWATVGSANMDMWSLVYNYELNVSTENTAFVEELYQQFLRDITVSKKVDPLAIRAPSLRQEVRRILGTLSRPFG